MVVTTPQSADKTDEDFVQSLARGLEVIQAFDRDNPLRTLSDVAKATGLTRATVRRSLLTLEKLGYVRSEGSLFTLAPKILELGHAYLSGLGLPDIARPHLRTLMEETGETTALSVRDGSWVVHVARVPASGMVTVAINVGTRFPAYATAMGRVLLAGLPADQLDAYLERVELQPLTAQTVGSVDQLRTVLARVAAEGYCVADRELHEALRAVAVPVRDTNGAVIAAANIATSTGLRTLEDLRGMLPALRRCADDIEAEEKLLEPR
ncbi:IclR family transcriptional regulator C-terminal domain-containing protein [Cryptosporangium sp. NPDC048952]|uniref:IclR family transcriptional regulator domain-containing protein n=1 Tax=Cryptosporangium sp. NPDC048952 TaxID=3363961 RepID=UPI003720BFDC